MAIHHLSRAVASHPNPGSNPGVSTLLPPCLSHLPLEKLLTGALGAGAELPPSSHPLRRLLPNSQSWQTCKARAEESEQQRGARRGMYLSGPRLFARHVAHAGVSRPCEMTAEHHCANGETEAWWGQQASPKGKQPLGREPEMETGLHLNDADGHNSPAL